MDQKKKYCSMEKIQLANINLYNTYLPVPAQLYRK